MYKLTEAEFNFLTEKMMQFISIQNELKSLIELICKQNSLEGTWNLLANGETVRFYTSNVGNAAAFSYFGEAAVVPSLRDGTNIQGHQLAFAAHDDGMERKFRAQLFD